jgi:SHAQKYF class myb-like DNA-binding protein
LQAQNSRLSQPEMNEHDEARRGTKRPASAMASSEGEDSGNNVSGGAGNDAEETLLGGEKWSQELHRCFISALFDCGVRHSSPSVILGNMSMRPASLTSERVKSHLQKFRKHKVRSKETFMADYDSFMGIALGVAGAVDGSENAAMPPEALAEAIARSDMSSGGSSAAFLSCVVMSEDGGLLETSIEDECARIPPRISQAPAGAPNEPEGYPRAPDFARIPFPDLSEEEKQTPWGKSIIDVWGKLSTVSKKLIQARCKPCKAKAPGGKEAGNTSQPGTSSSSPQHLKKERRKLLREDVDHASPPDQHLSMSTTPLSISADSGTAYTYPDHESPSQHTGEYRRAQRLKVDSSEFGCANGTSHPSPHLPLSTTPMPITSHPESAYGYPDHALSARHIREYPMSSYGRDARQQLHYYPSDRYAWETNPVYRSYHYDPGPQETSRHGMYGHCSPISYSCSSHTDEHASWSRSSEARGVHDTYFWRSPQEAGRPTDPYDPPTSSVSDSHTPLRNHRSFGYFHHSSTTPKEAYTGFFKSAPSSEEQASPLDDVPSPARCSTSETKSSSPDVTFGPFYPISAQNSTLSADMNDTPQSHPSFSPPN